MLSKNLRKTQRYSVDNKDIEKNCIFIFHSNHKLIVKKEKKLV